MEEEGGGRPALCAYVRRWSVLKGGLDAGRHTHLVSSAEAATQAAEAIRLPFGLPVDVAQPIPDEPFTHKVPVPQQVLSAANALWISVD